MLKEVYFAVINDRSRKRFRDNLCVFQGYADCLAYINSMDMPVFVSAVLKTRQANTLLHYMKRRFLLSVWCRQESGALIFNKNSMLVQTYKGRGGYTHLVLMRRPDQQTRNKYVPIYIPKDADESSATEIPAPSYIQDGVYHAILDNTSIPVLPEWSGYLAKQLLKERQLYSSNCIGDKDAFLNYGFRNIMIMNVSENTIVDMIQEGLQKKAISIAGCYNKSPALGKIKGIDSYQETFGAVLARKTKERFRPLFDPDKQQVSRKVQDFFRVCAYYHPGILPYKKQQEVIQAGMMSLDYNKSLVISGATGSGKTILSIGTVICHARKKNYSALVMVPSTLVRRWEEALLEAVPEARVRVVSDLAGFIEATKDIRNPGRLRPLWIILSENTAKMSYDEHPAVIWDARKKAYICPHCGRPLLVMKKANPYGVRYNEPTPKEMKIRDFLKKNGANSFCNLVRDSNGNDIKGCGNVLWTAASKNNSRNWVKIDRAGWIPKNETDNFQKELEDVMKHMDQNTAATFRKETRKYLEALSRYDISGAISRLPNRYSIAHYIRKHMNHCFDYFIADEVHQLEGGDSQQGKAFGTIIGAVWKCIFLTGTLSNGYAGGLFHLLFRTQTRKMLDDGYSIDSEKDFAERYGVEDNAVTERGSLISRSDGSVGISDADSKRTTRKKRLPGISPTLVSDYLMNSFISVRKSDISDHLCPYEEIPIGVEMDPELRKAYQKIITTVRSSVIRGHGYGDRRRVRNALMTATMFLDQPFGLDTSMQQYTPPETVGEAERARQMEYKRIELSDKIIRNKEKELVRLVKKHKEKGEKILIYIEYTNKLDLAGRLQRILAKEGIRASYMDASVKQTERQSWLEAVAGKGEADAVILNPGLVEVGLNLLDYTTIIFYEVGTKVTTVRQASQRSNRINQTKPVTVYFMYYRNTIQEDTLGAISQKMTASKAVEGDFTESALQEMGETTDILTQLVNSIAKDDHIEVEQKNFEHSGNKEDQKISHIPKQRKMTCFKDRPRFSLWGTDGSVQTVSLCV